MPTRSIPTSDRIFYIVSLLPDPGYEAKFNEWYDTEHIPELLACPGFEDARRFQLVDGQTGSPPYLATYEVTTMAAFESDDYLRQRNRAPAEMTPLAREVFEHRSWVLSAKYREILHHARAD